MMVMGLSKNLAFGEQIARLRADVAEMGGLAEAAIEGAILAFTRRDVEGAAAIVVADRRIDAMEAEVERQVVRLIGTHAPHGEGLRDLLSALKIASVVERIGDYAKNIAKRVPLLSDTRGIAPVAILPAMARTAADMVREALNAFAARDPTAAIAVVARDRALDDLYNSLFRALVSHMGEHPSDIDASTHLLFIAKNLERIGDHATNAAEMVHFAATGIQLTERARGIDTLAPAEG